MADDGPNLLVVVIGVLLGFGVLAGLVLLVLALVLYQWKWKKR